MRKIRETKWEKSLIASGREIITWEHDDIVDYLIAIFNRDKENLLLMAASDDTKRHTLCFLLDFEGRKRGGLGETNFGGTVVYNKKKRKFTHITYSDRYNWGIIFSIDSRVTFFCRDFYLQLKHVFPFGYSHKSLHKYLMGTYPNKKT